MTLGEKLLQARQEAGLSQRQLCGEEITRNMLSQIEHGTARPSMDTLRYLAARLGKSVSFFLEEDAVQSPNWELMQRARSAFEAGDWEKTRLLLNAYVREAAFDREYAYLAGKSALAAARTALGAGKTLYARELLEEAGEYAQMIPELERQRLLLLGEIPRQNLEDLCRNLPSLDEELMLRAKAARQAEQPERAARWLDAAEDRSGAPWLLLRGQIALDLEQWEAAANFLHRAEDTLPKETAPLLETCYRELGDYKRAYEYACKQK